MMSIPSIFGSRVFNDGVMKQRLDEDVYKSLHKTIDEGMPLDINVANSVAMAMKEWAIENGATHFTHWFQPMTGITAEKHDSFISPQKDGTVIMEFSGKELIKGESDASSFPSGGLRATFEARGYTAWDPTSYAFIKDKSLYIPTVFCSWSGEALDKKTPLMRSMEAVNTAALRILRLFGNDKATRVNSTVGAEQEYFLIDREMYNKRKDLIYTGRTLFGAKPPKGQDVEHHYYGAIKPRISAFMCDLDEELWKLGVFAKTKHNEAAPSQHELAPVFTEVNTATDHNQLIMETMKRVAEKHGLVCLLHEKPFEGMNGSGKHNNWSLSTDTGENLFAPGASPSSNAQFLLFLVAVIRAVDEYQDILRLAVATAGNDHRLGSSEAPPSIVSMFLGDELTELLEALERKETYDGKERVEFEIGIDALPHFPKDISDRNRTSPFAFTGNKWEFRMPGSTLSIAGPNIVLNTIVAEVLEDFAEELEKAEDFTASLGHLIRRNIRNHRRIIFNGDGYSDEWRNEAKRRGLDEYPTTADALPVFVSPKSIALFTKHRIFSEKEIRSRCDILLQTYCDTVRIEALTMLDMVRKEIYPALTSYINEMGQTVLTCRQAGLTLRTEEEMLKMFVDGADAISDASANLETLINHLDDKNELFARARFVSDELLPSMKKLRIISDSLEAHCPRDRWPFPDYGDLLFNF